MKLKRGHVVTMAWVLGGLFVVGGLAGAAFVVVREWRWPR
jgi:hypothetical protein